jgi:hypothetical protein
MHDVVSVARRVERHRALAAQQLSTDSLAIGGGFATYCGPGSFTNRACAIGLDGPVSNEDIATLIDFFESRDERARIEVCSYAHASLIQGLAANGFVLEEFGNVLALPLSTSVGELAVSLPDGLSIERVDGSDPERARAFAQRAERNFANEDDPVSDLAVDLITRSLLAPTHDAFVVRTSEGEIVGTASSESADGLTMLFGGAVTPDWRHRGIHRAMMVARLVHGQTRGSDLACVIAPPGLTTERNAVRLGFAMAYTRASLSRR